MRNIYLILFIGAFCFTSNQTHAGLFSVLGQAVTSKSGQEVERSALMGGMYGTMSGRGMGGGMGMMAMMMGFGSWGMGACPPGSAGCMTPSMGGASGAAYGGMGAQGAAGAGYGARGGAGARAGGGAYGGRNYSSSRQF